ncbi:unnamed protein product [Ilex paraguariensis]|uniref:Uncharacterized protein n=1 Tax=Ilex paraguariensis TaxID=185542 RepID=A0ABC8UYP5_9AQUA
MDLWVVAAAAGAGYLAKYRQNLSGEKDGLPETSSWNSIHRRQSESPASNLLQQMRDSTCPLRRLARKSFDRDISERGDSGEASEGVASTSGREWFQERINEKSEFFNTSGNVLYESKTEEISAFHGDGRIRRMTRSLRSRSSGYSVRPSTSLESCLVAQLYREHEKKEEHVFSSLPSPSTNSNRPLLLTDGRQKISRTSNDLFGASLDSGEDKLQRENGVFLEENDALMGPPTLGQIGLMDLPRKQRQRHDKSRQSSYSTELSGKSFLSQEII